LKVTLVYNILNSISGEKTFFDNIVGKLSEKEIEVQECAIPSSTNIPPFNKIEFYSRFPMLLNARRRLENSDSDVLHFLNSSLCPSAPRKSGCAKIATLHHFASMYYEMIPPEGILENTAESIYCRYINAIEKNAFRNLDCLVTCTDAPQDFVAKEYKMEKSKMKTIYPGVDIDYFKNIPKADLKSKYGCGEIIAYIGRLHERTKGISYLIHAIKKTNRKNLKLLIIGDGPDRKYYEWLISKLDLNDKIIMLGRLSSDEKSVIQKSADLIAIPSLYELFGTVFAESLACGTPVVAFDMPFWKELYADAGLFVKPRDYIALAEGIEKVLDDENLRKKLISKGYETCSKYDLKKVTSSYISLYEELSGLK